VPSGLGIHSGYWIAALAPVDCVLPPQRDNVVGLAERDNVVGLAEPENAAPRAEMDNRGRSELDRGIWSAKAARDVQLAQASQRI
jgi:hypothetical protein